MKILFISHDSSQTGAPKTLALFLVWLQKHHPDIKFDLLLKAGDKFPLTNIKGNVLAFNPAKFGRSAKLWNRCAYHLNILKLLKVLYRKKLFSKIKKQNYDIIYSNTIVNDDVLKFLANIECKKIVHAQELQSSINDYGGKVLVKTNIKYANIFIAITNAVKANLITNGVDPNKIKVVNNHIELKKANPNFATKLRKEYKIPDDAFVIGGCGGFIWRKGFDLFVSLAAKFRSNENIYFIWYGKPPEEKLFEINYELNRLGLTSRFLIDTFKQHQAIDYFSIFNCFVLTSREEPFGLVGLESALNKVPVLCFDNAGGQPDFVSKGAGYIVPYLDIDAFEEKINFLRNNPGIRKTIGEKGYQIAFNNYDIEVVAPKLLKIIEYD